MYSSLQFSGHAEEYFAKHTQKLIVFVIMPRLKNKYNLLRRYEKGSLVEEKKTWSSDNLVLYYLSWYFHYLKFIFKYFNSKEKLIVLSMHPISFFGMTVQKVFRRITYAYWVGDYFPPTDWKLILFEKLKKFYHDRINFTYYLGDNINKKMNGKVVNTKNKRTVMWGVRKILGARQSVEKKFNLLFVGLVKEGQGVENIFSFLREHKNYSVKIIGICPDHLYKRYMSIIKRFNISDQVFFPNKFYSDKELMKVAQKCHAGVALYDMSPLNATYYTDPGKVKAYAEFGLPIIMSNTSAVSNYISKLGCGEIINSNEDIESSLVKIRSDYAGYCEGVRRFLKYFDFEDYYRRSFRSLETK